MDVLTFVTKLVEALAWPIVGALLVLALWPHFGDLARRLEEVGFGRAKAKFVREATPRSPVPAPPIRGEEIQAAPTASPDPTPTVSPKPGAPRRSSPDLPRDRRP